MKKIVICLLIISLFACSKKEEVADWVIAERERQSADMSWSTDTPRTREKPQNKEKGNYFSNRENPAMISYSYFYVVTSSELPGYDRYNLTDRTWKSWAEGVEGNGIGEYFSLQSRVETFTTAGFALKNGYGDLNYYSQNNRVKSLKIQMDGKYIETIPIKDSTSFELYIFEKPLTGDSLYFIIDDVYPGTEFNDTCVAEIVLLSRAVDETEFYENILFWFDADWPGSDGSYFNVNHEQVVSVSDMDRKFLLDYLPFGDVLHYYDDMIRITKKTKIALLNGVSSLKFTNNLPRLDGATAMYPLYSSFVHAVYPQVNLDWKEGEDDYFTALYQWVYFPNLDLLFDLLKGGYRSENVGYGDFGSIAQCNTTSQAFERLMDGETDIIFCYEPSEAEKNAAADKGKQFNLTPVAYDAFVFIVNDKNSLTNITQQQIRDIYSGRVTNWKSISGADEAIIAYQRPANSGSQTTLQSIMKEDQLIRPILDGEFIPRGMFGMIRKITSNYYNYNSAIGYTFLFYLTQMAGNVRVKTLAIDGVAPTSQTIQNKSYPFTQTVYAITTGNESENARKFIEWILSPQGQELVAKTGYTPVK